MWANTTTASSCQYLKLGPAKPDDVKKESTWMSLLYLSGGSWGTRLCKNLFLFLLYRKYRKYSLLANLYHSNYRLQSDTLQSVAWKYFSKWSLCDLSIYLIVGKSLAKLLVTGPLRLAWRAPLSCLLVTEVWSVSASLYSQYTVQTPVVSGSSHRHSVAQIYNWKMI